ncbi:hypothetical protein [Actinoplanes sp. NPDC026623]|uniref:hypothetical protein n=1 Tax=Actinoplanes sp. NPDC026623 TaxID=3155610 RepID=UPI0033E9CD60
MTVTLAVGGTLAANATWSIPSTPTSVKLTTVDLPRGPKPNATKENGGAVITWSSQEIVPGTAMRGYIVTRHDTDDESSSKVFAAIAGTTLTDTGMPPGKFYWTVTPKFAAWTGEESTKSENLKFTAPAASARTAVVTGAPPPGRPTPSAAPTQTAGGGSGTADPPPAPPTGPTPPKETDPPPVAATTTPPPTETVPDPDPSGDVGQQ